MSKSKVLKALKAEVKALKGDREKLARFAMGVTSILEDVTEILDCQDNGDLAEVYMDFHCSIPDNEDEDEEDEDEDDNEDEVEDEVEEARIKMIKHKFGW